MLLPLKFVFLLLFSQYDISVMYFYVNVCVLVAVLLVNNTCSCCSSETERLLSLYIVLGGVLDVGGSSTVSVERSILILLNCIL